MIVKLLTEHNLEFLCLKVGCRGSSESTHVEMPHCWKSHALAHIESVYVPYFRNTIHGHPARATEIFCCEENQHRSSLARC